MSRVATEWPGVTAVVLNYNGADLTSECVRSLLESDYPHLRVLIVDDASTDDSEARLRERHPAIPILRMPLNRGFAGAANGGIAAALRDGADYILLLNNDTRADRSMIRELVAAALRHEGRAAVGPTIYAMRDPGRIWFAYGTTNLWFGLFSNVLHGKSATEIEGSEREMEFMIACSVLMPRKMLEQVGGFDSALGMYCEDADWSIRVRRAGYRLVLAPRASLWHWVSATGDRQPVRRRYLMTRNHIWVVRRYANRRQFFVFAASLPLRSLVRASRMAVSGDFRGIQAEIRGLRDGLFHAPPQPMTIIGGSPEHDVAVG